MLELRVQVLRTNLKLILTFITWWLIPFFMVLTSLFPVKFSKRLYDVSIQVFEEDGISLIATFIGKPVMLDSYISFMCNDSWGRSSFAWSLIEVNSKVDFVNVVTIGILYLLEMCSPKKLSVLSMNGGRSGVIYSIDGFQTMGKKKNKKGKSKSTNGGQFAGPSVKQTIRYEPKTTGTSSKKDKISTSNSFSTLNNDEEDEDEAVENVYDESANLLPNTKTGGNSSFTAVAC
nr:hypothetical protein [Tanacetum cinerariifolium]